MMRVFMSSCTQEKLSGIYTNQRGPSLEQRPSDIHMQHKSYLSTVTACCCHHPSTYGHAV